MAQDTAIPAEKAAAQPRVYGYVRMAKPEPDGTAELEAELTAWCEREGWLLCAIFRDIGVSAEALIRPGLAAALDVLALPDSYALVVLDGGHLSTLGVVAKRLRSAVRRTGARLLVRDENSCHGSTDDTGAA